ncbi:MAG: hypothetical protein JNM18_12615 [Planctomycetaceae bacterium]|nr:hypothetical protein [Planctomycetaceae bacterium]
MRWIILAGVCCLAQIAAANSLEQSFLDGLRTRRLFALAEQFCREQLARADLPPIVQGELTVEFSRTLVEHALNAAPDQRAPLWKQADEVVEQFARTQPQHPRLPLVQAQAAIVKLAQGQFARQEAELGVSSPTQYDAARALLRQSVERFDLVSKTIDEQLRTRNLQRAASPDLLSADELLQLQKHVALHRARALRQQGESYPVGSPDRIAALTRAIEVLGPLVGLDPTDPVCFTSRVEEMACLRLAGDRQTAARRIAALDELKPSANVVLQARAETIRLLLDANRATDAIELAQAEVPPEASSADWDYAVLEANVAAWRAASDAQREDEMKSRQQAAVDQIRQIDARHGPYWSRRAEMLLAAHIAVAPGVGDLDVLLRSAESFYRGGQIEQALNTYDELAKRAVANQQPQRALDAAFTAAAIEQSRGNHVLAASRFHRAADLAPELNKAREAHLAAIWNTAKAYPQPSAEQTTTYEQLIAEHLMKWPRGATSDQARSWLGQLCEGRRAWSAAVDAYRAISAAGPLYEPTLVALTRSYLAWLDELRKQQQPTETLATTAATFFEQAITRGLGRWPEKWSPSDRVSAVSAARIWLDYSTGRADRVEQLLTAALAQAEGAPPEWITQARLLAIQAQVATGKIDAALDSAGQITGADPERLVSLLEALQQQAQIARPEHRAAIGQLTLDVARSKPAEPPLSADQQRRYDLAQGQALAAVGRRDEALKLLAALSVANPQQAAVQEAYAATLSTGTTAADQELALTKWREIERRSKPGSERWFRTKLRLAQGHLALGRKDRAKQIIELTQILHPELGGAALKSEFLAVLKRCE